MAETTKADEVAGTKGSLRRQMKALRESLGAEERAGVDARIAAHVAASDVYREAEALFTYVSVGAEVDTRAIMRDAWSRGKLVAVPRVVPGTRSMEWHAIEGFDGLMAGSFGIEEPPSDSATLVSPGHLVAVASALALVPGYSFDAQGYRLGYGGGFYDEFLPSFQGVSVGLCRSVQLSAKPLPRREADVAVDCVATETGLVVVSGPLP